MYLNKTIVFFLYVPLRTGKELCPEPPQAFCSQNLKLYLINKKNIQDYLSFED